MSEQSDRGRAAHRSEWFGWLAAAAILCLTQAALAQQNGDSGPVIYAMEAPGVVRIHAVGVAEDGSMGGEDGTGFVISRSGYVLTASHVIPHDAKYKTLILGGTLGPATADAKPSRLELVKRSDSYDVALLRFVTPPPGLTVLPLRRSPAKVGELLFVLGYPLGLPDAHFLDGRLGAVAQDAITTNALVDKGNSGGPVVDARGCVIGIVYGAITSRQGQPVNGIKFAVPVLSISGILPPDVSSSAAQEPTRASEIIHVSDALSRTQEDHALADTVRSYHDVIPARDGFVIEAIEGVGHESLNPPRLQFPTPVISPDKKSMSFDYSLVSGPIYDQRRGWIDMTIGTRQRRISTAPDAALAGCE
ncbi:peptidase S1 and S6, chymotrypsin/Hap [Nitrobacter hamburgensis X14]|uniref:Peptidase S1 and S6, chymotrypsin/Hap n=1 Tax=Nitrobacter hamburgensis (strain DSM 10229 / NCIMB 13809 / X14) TaxID=323097 RepID=Q1QH59_NITHX|nr:serine protease [Nitrobacter hamburgensis]ABE64438.1 peptidase S1 and S6, chymotrypsin/Hap [Nitrobacter hamburgensis X14]